MRYRTAMAIAVLAGLATAAFGGERVPDAAIRAHSYETLVRRLTHYVHPGVAARVTAQLTIERDRILAQSDNAGFMAALNQTLYASSRDRHLQVMLSNGEPAPAEAPDGKYGIERVARLTGDIAYVEISGFSSAPESRRAMDAAMAQTAGAKALILDVRKNGGGGQVSFLRLLGHLFPARTELNGISWRTCVEDAPRASPDVCVQGAPRIERQFSDRPATPAFSTGPIYVLTSKATFSAAEALAYELKVHDRATIVGETTGGGGNPSAGMDLESAFFVIMPIGKMHKVTKGDGWEGTGVAPDVAVPAAEAEAAALKAIATG